MVTAGIFPFKENSRGRAGNRTWDLMISSQRLWLLDHEAGLDGKVKVGKIIQKEYLYGTENRYGQVSIGTKYIQYSTLYGMHLKIKIFSFYIENKLKSQFRHTQRKANCCNTSHVLLTRNTCRNRKERHTSHNHVVHHKKRATLPTTMFCITKTIQQKNCLFIRNICFNKGSVLWPYTAGRTQCHGLLPASSLTLLVLHHCCRH